MTVLPTMYLRTYLFPVQKVCGVVHQVCSTVAALSEILFRTRLVQIVLIDISVNCLSEGAGSSELHSDKDSKLNMLKHI